jgi:predicted dinucleotide-binding enzyme
LEDAMQIGILGAGRMGQMLARLLFRAGHSVQLSNARGPESLADLVAELGPGARATTPAAMLADNSVIILATRWDQTPAAVGALGPWDGKIVVDTTNNRFGPNPADMYDLGGRTSSEVVAELVPGARLVKAFNHQPIPALATLGETASEDRRALFVAGDDRAANQLVGGLIRDMGGEPIVTGGLRDGGRLQATGGPLAGQGRLLSVAEARALLSSQQTAAAR